MKIIKFDVIDSTNTYLKTNYDNFDNLTFVVANHQTNGKGRLGRTWIDEDDLLLSILVKENIERPTDYSLLIGAVLVKVLKKYSPKIKWPNDIIINDKKCIGILLEGVTKEKQECVIIGVGINVNTTVFPKDLLFKATSLKNESKEEINKESLLKSIINEFINEYNNYVNNKSDYLNIIRNNFYLDGKEISFLYNNKEEKGIVKGIDDMGNLIAKTDNQLLYLNSGEVTLNNIYKK